MRAEEILQLELRGLKGHVHARRVAAVCRAAAALLQGGRATLTGIGRSMTGAHTKHLIKAVDRLLGNVLLHAQLWLIYATLSHRLLSALPRRPVLLIDWTDIGPLWAALTVTLVSEGRGVVIYAQAYPRRRENDPRAESACLRKLKTLIGNAKPIIVSDAGFRGPWMRKVMDAGWDFVGRLRGRVLVRRNGTIHWQRVKSLWASATTQPTSLGDMEFARYSPVAARLVLVLQHRSTKKRLPKIGHRKKKQIRSAREPWVLATSMREASAKAIVDLYRTRMRIEETFRDQKCPRFGFGLDHARTNNLQRINVLLLLVVLAHYAAMLIGAAAEAAKLHLRFQANTVKAHRVLALPRLAQEVLRKLSAAQLSCLLPRLGPAALALRSCE